MGYSAADESFTHQLGRPFDQVHSDDGSWSDRCYFFAHSPDGDAFVANGMGYNPNQLAGAGYGKVAFADGRHHDLLVGRPISGSDRAEVHAGPMRWTCVEPLKRWRLDVEPNDSGVEWEMYYEPRAPMWELLPMDVDEGDRKIIDMFHMKESGVWTGWFSVDGERTSVDGWHGGRDRTFGVRVADEINFWIWLDVGFEDQAVQAWLIEDHDGGVQYVDGGITRTDGTVSDRIVAIEHDIGFDRDHKRPAEVALRFTFESGETERLTGRAEHQHVNCYYGRPLDAMAYQDYGGGEYLVHFPWDAGDETSLREIEGRSMAMDQLMHFDWDGRRGIGVFEILTGSDSTARYPNWPAMDMEPFRQRAKRR